MKYIVVQLTMKDIVRELPFVFADHCTHSVVADHMCMMLMREHRGAVARPISAGFLSSLSFDTDCCHGKSESLKMNSRPKQDSDLLLSMDYSHGIVA